MASQRTSSRARSSSARRWRERGARALVARRAAYPEPELDESSGGGGRIGKSDCGRRRWVQTRSLLSTSSLWLSAHWQSRPVCSDSLCVHEPVHGTRLATAICVLRLCELAALSLGGLRLLYADVYGGFTFIVFGQNCCRKYQKPLSSHLHSDFLFWSL